MMSGKIEEIIVTPEQKQCIEYNSGDLLVKGIAGAGKSIVLLKRIAKLYKEALQTGENIKIGFFTYAKTLVHNTEEILGDTINNNMVTISTIDKHAIAIYQEITGTYPNLLKPTVVARDTKKMITTVLENHYKKSNNKKHRFYNVDTDFWKDEFQWIKEKGIKNVEEYIASDRKGRGGKIKMSGRDKYIAFEFYQEYNTLLKTKNIQEWGDIYNKILNSVEKIPKKFYFHHVLVDEAQDLSLVKLKLLKLLALKDITLVADQAQKIYNTSFNWKDIGIQIRGRGSKTLNTTFRSTKEIISFANSLIQHNKKNNTKDEEYIEPILPERTGEKPVVLECSNEQEEELTTVQIIHSTLKADSRQKIGVLYRTKKEKNKIIRWLKNKNIAFQEIIGQKGWSLLQPGVKLVTLHSAKGLEFDTVIIPKLCEGIMPKLGSGIDKEQEEELLVRERCVLYVGMTRAKYSLYLIYSSEKSRFIEELDKSLCNFKQY